MTRAKKTRFCSWPTIINFIVALMLTACVSTENARDKITKVWLIGDSTVADYSLESDYHENRYPITGWGQVLQPYLSKDSLSQFRKIILTDSVEVVDKAKGGRSTRTFFQEGRWREVFDQLQSGDLVLIQFGHNDAAISKPERFVNLQGYKEFLRLYVSQAREKNAVPILITPVARNYPWENNHLANVHGDYPDAMKEIAHEMNVKLIDLNQMSMDFFSQKGRDYITAHYFMNLPKGKYPAYPDGSNDNTHFQPEGALAVARLLVVELKKIDLSLNLVK